MNPASTGFNLVFFLGGLLGLGLGAGLLYLLFFNRQNRRSLHDSVTGTVVVQPSGAIRSTPNHEIWSGHLVAVGLLFAISALGPPIVWSQTMQKRVTAAPTVSDYLSTELGTGKLAAWNQGKPGTSRPILAMEILYTRNPAQLKPRLKEIAKKISSEFPKRVDNRTLSIKGRTIYHFGIFTWETFTTYSCSGLAECANEE